MENITEIFENTAEQHFANPFAAILQRHARRWMAWMLAASDLLMLFLAGSLAVVARNALGAHLDAQLYLGIAPILLAFSVKYYFNELYPGVGMGVVEEFRRLTSSTSLMFLILIAITFVMHGAAQYSRLIIGMAYLGALVLVPGGRILVRHAAVRMGAWGEPVAVIGALAPALGVIATLKRDAKNGLKPVAVFTSGGAARAQAVKDVQVLPESSMGEVIRRYNLKTAIVIADSLDDLASIRRQYETIFQRIVIVSADECGCFTENIRRCEMGGLTGLEVRQNLLDRWAQFEKRVIDLIAAGLGLLALAPLFAALAALIKIDSPGRVFYRQKRLGRSGATVEMLKFRTMHMNADEVLKQKLLENPAMKAEWDEYQKLRDDPRITRVGKFLRRFSVDELPQLWNIFKGEMSLVGPRPIMLDQREMYGDFQKFYTRVTPGLTGLWQISGRNLTSFARRVDYDVQYVKDWSLWLDIYILVRTVWVVLKREGAG